jgi:hypothetical protein
VLAVVLMIAWLASWRALAKAVITRGARRVE